MSNQTPLRRFEYRDSRSNKYWEVIVEESVVTAHWGRMNTAGAYQPKTFGNHSLAKAHADKMIREKLSKGYNEVTTNNTTISTDGIAVQVFKKPLTDQPTKPSMSSDEKQKRAFRI